MSLNLLSLCEGVLLEQCTRSWSDISNSITRNLLTFWEELVKTWWCIRVAVLLITQLGIEVSCSREKEKQKSK